jgi:glycosyltransferase involved in cell wall biosynthesis
VLVPPKPMKLWRRRSASAPTRSIVPRDASSPERVKRLADTVTRTLPRPLQRRRAARRARADPGGGGTRRPRILFVITLAETGGAQAYVASLLPALARNFDVAVAAHGTGPLESAAIAASVRFIPLRHLRRPISPWRDALALLELLLLLRRERPDVLHANSSKAGIIGRVAAALVGVPIRIFTVHGWAFSAHDGLAAVAYRYADRLVSPLTTRTICVAESERVAGLRAGTCRVDRTVVIPNAVAVASALRHRGDAAVPVVVSVGRFSKPKDFVTLARSLAMLDRGSFRALLVGDGPDRAELEAELQHLGLDGAVELLGTREDVAELLAGADVFVLSSTSEGLPISILEAMAAGLPVVASSVGGVPEAVVDGETGLLVPPGDPAALAAALRRLTTDGELRRRLGTAALARAEALFDLPRFQDAHVEVYSRTLADRGLPVPTR